MTTVEMAELTRRSLVAIADDMVALRDAHGRVQVQVAALMTANDVAPVVADAVK